MQQHVLGRRDHLTFRGNRANGRYGWLRLTPAYSVHLVTELVEEHRDRDAVVLDPFCGTGTTALVCAERGIACDTTDINPFLLWLARTKTSTYSASDRKQFRRSAAAVTRAILGERSAPTFVPPLHALEKWWSAPICAALGRAMAKIRQIRERTPCPAVDLLNIAFGQAMIACANVSFAHQSMSFKKPRPEPEPEPELELEPARGRRGAARHADPDSIATPPSVPILGSGDEHEVAHAWQDRVATIAEDAASEIRVPPSATLCDARSLSEKLASNHYTSVITSPPYPNRMSYIRELRPYMYWLGYLTDRRQAGELDWQAIGGTWGCATSNLIRWQPDRRLRIPYRGFHAIVDRISSESGVLGRYVLRYFHDLYAHCHSLYDVVAPGGSIHYVVGNSKFYDVVLPVESIYAAMFEAAGFAKVRVEAIRKRSSKRELYEYLVSGRKP